MVIKMIIKSFGCKIRTIRESVGFSQNQLSDLTGITREQISRIENGEYRVVTNDYVYDKENGPYMLYGYSEIIYDGNIRDWVIEELSLQAAAGLTFDVNNPILSQTIDPISVRSDRYYVKAFI
jgi:hypothetical protein